MALPSVFMSELTLTQVEDFPRADDRVLVPMGSTEQHGPHSPLSTDVIIPTEVCQRIARRVQALVAPAIPYGISSEHRGFGGLAYLNAATFMSVIEDVAFSLAEAGFRRIVFVNGHYPNYHSINIACRNVSTRVPEGTRAWGVSYWESLRRRRQRRSRRTS